MHVEIDHGHPKQAPFMPMPFGLHQARGHGDVVEHAIAAALARVGVVGAPGQIGGHALTAKQRRASGQDRGAHGAPGALDHLGRPGKTDLALLCGAQRPLHHRIDPAGLVGQRQHPVGGGLGLAQAYARQGVLDRPPQQLVLGHRERVARGQRQHERVGMEGEHRRILGGCRAFSHTVLN